MSADSVWMKQYDLSWSEWLGVKVLRQGRVPRHVAVIMDGNRRFARQAGQEVISGHRAGFEKLAETLQWCREIGIREVTVYAFSIENFNRAEAEVSDLLNLARDKFVKLLEEADKLNEAGVRVRILGNLSYLPADLRETVTEVERVTEANTESLLNIALSYTAREEITHAVRELAVSLAEDRVTEDEVTEARLERLLYTSDSPAVELLIRTSGETRLSDFMLWQASKSITYFSPVLWPEFSLWQLLLGVFFFQRQEARRSGLLDTSRCQAPGGDTWRCLEQRTEVASLLETWSPAT